MQEIQGFGLFARVSDAGAELQSLRTAAGEELLWQGDAAWWRGRSPILFPIVGRAEGDVVEIDGSPFTLLQHGFARRSTFALCDAGADFTRHVLEESAESLLMYPRRFRLEIEHRLTAQGLVITAEVTNTDNRILPFGLGFHPAFAWPLPGTEGAAHQIRLGNGAEPEQTVLEAGLLSRKTQRSPFKAGVLLLEPELFAQDALIFLEGAGDALTYGVVGGRELAFSFENLPFVAFWTKPGAPFLCVEPWHGAAALAGARADIAARPGAILLEPGDARRFAVTVTPRGF